MFVHGLLFRQFVLISKNVLVQEVYKQMCECQELNPEEGSDSEEDGIEEYEGVGDESDGRYKFSKAVKRLKKKCISGGSLLIA